MRLTDFTDFSLRSLIYLNRNKGLVTLDELSDAIGVSRNHLIKITNKLVKEGLIESVRGRSGGLRIEHNTGSIKLGEIVQVTEESLELVECHRSANPRCPLLSGCKLKRSLDRALESFIDSLNEKTLNDIC